MGLASEFTSPFEDLAHARFMAKNIFLKHYLNSLF